MCSAKKLAVYPISDIGLRGGGVALSMRVILLNLHLICSGGFMKKGRRWQERDHMGDVGSILGRHGGSITGAKESMETGSGELGIGCYRR